MTTRLTELAISTTGNITGNIVAANVVRTDNYQYANGTPFSGGGGGSYGNTEVGNFLAAGLVGNIIPLGNAVYSLGNATNQWSNLWVANNTIYLGGVPIGITAGNVLTVNGNAVLQNNSNSSISTTGNITADYFIGDGSQLTNLPGGSGNTGNVTFDNQVIQGTGDQYGGSGLYLAPGTDSTGNLQYLRVRGGDYVTHIHLDTGNNQYFDQYFGDDNKYVKLEATGNVVISADNGANSESWTFGTGGDLTVPGGILGGGNLKLSPDSANTGSYLDIFLTSGPDLHLVASASANLILGKDDGANIMTSWNGNAYIQSWNQNTGNIGGTWTFSGDGSTIFPTLNVARGDTTSGNISGYTLNIGDGQQEGIITTPDGDANGNPNSQRIVINPGKGADTTSGEGGDIYLWAGRGGDQGGSGGDVKIRGGQGMVNGAGGYIRMEGGDGQGVGQAGYITMDGGSAVDNSGGYLQFRGGYSQNNDGGYIQIQGGYSTNGEGGDVNIIGGGSDGGQGLFGNIGMQSGSRTWAFNNAGNLVLPSEGNLVGTTPNNTGHLQWVGNSSGDGAGYTTMRLVPDDDVEGNDQYVILDPTAPGHIHIRAGGTQDASSADLFLGGENSHVKIAAGANSDVVVRSNSNNWTFDTLGTLTLPGEGVLRSIGDVVTLQSINVGSGNANSVYLGSSGGLGFFDQEIGGNWLEIFRNGAEPEIRVPVGLGNLNIQTAEGNTAYNWTFDNTGNLTIPGAMVVAGGIVGGALASPAPSLSGFSSVSAIDISASGNVTGSVGFFNDVIVNNVTTNKILYANDNREIYDTVFSYDSGNSIMSGSGSISVTGNISAGNILIGGTPLTRSLTVGTRTTAVTVPLSTNNSFEVLTRASGNIAVPTT